MKNYLYLLLAVMFVSCQPEVISLEETFDCTIDSEIYFTHQSYETNEFQFFHPRNWKLVTTTNQLYTSYLFADSIPSFTDEELLGISDDALKDIQNEFHQFIIMQDKIDEGFDYDLAMKQVLDLVEGNKENEILAQGVADYDGRAVGWIKFSDGSYKKDGLRNLSLATCIEGESNYLKIIASVIGEKDVEARLCESIEIISTINVK